MNHLLVGESRKKIKEIASSSFDEGVKDGYAYVLIYFGYGDEFLKSDPYGYFFVPKKEDLKEFFRFWDEDETEVIEIYDLSQNKEEQISKECCWSAPQPYELHNNNWKEIKDSAIKNVTEGIYHCAALVLTIMLGIFVVYIFMIGWPILVAFAVLGIAYCIYNDAQNDWAVLKKTYLR